MTTVFRCNLRLTDVHATAETVGQEFRKLTDRFGMECVAELLSPVVQALEWLEAYVESYQQLQTTVSELEMENDTLEYEREQRALMAAKNESLEGTIRELQKENRCLLMEMDDIYYRNQELSTLLESKIDYPVKHTATVRDAVGEESLSPARCAPPSPPPHTPNRVVHLSQTYPFPPCTSHSPNFTPSPPPTLPASLLRPSPADSTPTPTPGPPLHNHHPSPPSPDSQEGHPFLHTLPVSPLPSPSRHHCSPKSHPAHTPPAHRVIQLVGRSSSLSDMVKVRVQTGQLHHHHEDEDMFERSRVTRRLSRLEAELETTTQQLGDLQRSRERLTDENKQLKIRVENLQAEVSLGSIVSNHREQPTEEAPRYYKKDVVHVLTERNRLKEQVHSLQEELEQLRDALKKTATGTRSRQRRSEINRVTDTQRGTRRMNSVRNILTESICLDSYPNFHPFCNGSPQKTHS